MDNPDPLLLRAKAEAPNVCQLIAGEHRRVYVDVQKRLAGTSSMFEDVVKSAQQIISSFTEEEIRNGLVDIPSLMGLKAAAEKDASDFEGGRARLPRIDIDRNVRLAELLCAMKIEQYSQYTHDIIESSNVTEQNIAGMLCSMCSCASGAYNGDTTTDISIGTGLKQPLFGFDSDKVDEIKAMSESGRDRASELTRILKQLHHEPGERVNEYVTKQAPAPARASDSAPTSPVPPDTALSQDAVEFDKALAKWSEDARKHSAIIESGLNLFISAAPKFHRVFEQDFYTKFPSNMGLSASFVDFIFRVIPHEADEYRDVIDFILANHAPSSANKIDIAAMEEFITTIRDVEASTTDSVFRGAQGDSKLYNEMITVIKATIMYANLKCNTMKGVARLESESEPSTDVDAGADAVSGAGPGLSSESAIELGDDGDGAPALGITLTTPDIAREITDEQLDSAIRKWVVKRSSQDVNKHASIYPASFVNLFDVVDETYHELFTEAGYQKHSNSIVTSTLAMSLADLVFRDYSQDAIAANIAKMHAWVGGYQLTARALEEITNEATDIRDVTEKMRHEGNHSIATDENMRILTSMLNAIHDYALLKMQQMTKKK